MPTLTIHLKQTNDYNNTTLLNPTSLVCVPTDHSPKAAAVCEDTDYGIKAKHNLMKKAILLISILYFISESLKAQIQIGAKSGVNYVNTVLNNTPNGIDSGTKYRLGYHIGIYNKIPIYNKLSFRPELLFSSKGYSFERLPNSPLTEDGSMHLNYINLPLLLDYKVVDKIALTLGPELGYLLTAKSKRESGTFDTKNLWDNFFDFGLSTGINYLIYDKLGIEFRYTHGFSSVMGIIYFTDQNGATLKEKSKFQNRAFQLSAYYQIR